MATEFGRGTSDVCLFFCCFVKPLQSLLTPKEKNLQRAPRCVPLPWYLTRTQPVDSVSLSNSASTCLASIKFSFQLTSKMIWRTGTGSQWNLSLGAQASHPNRRPGRRFRCEVDVWGNKNKECQKVHKMICRHVVITWPDLGGSSARYSEFLNNNLLSEIKYLQHGWNPKPFAESLWEDLPVKGQHGSWKIQFGIWKCHHMVHTGKATHRPFSGLRQLPEVGGWFHLLRWSMCPLGIRTKFWQPTKIGSPISIRVKAWINGGVFPFTYVHVEEILWETFNPQPYVSCQNYICWRGAGLPC